MIIGACSSDADWDSTQLGRGVGPARGDSANGRPAQARRLTQELRSSLPRRPGAASAAEPLTPTPHPALLSTSVPHDAGDRHSHQHQHRRHDHATGWRAGARHARPLTISLAMLLALLVVQVITGVVTGSLALLSDAGHMATDALGLGMALAAIRVASMPGRRSQRTFGLYRLEILAALFNAILLFGVAGYVLFEAARRLDDAPDVASLPVLVVGALGLVVNVVAFVLLRSGAAESLNVRGAYLEVVADMVGSVGVVVGAAVWGLAGWAWVDPVIGAGIGLFILPRAWTLGREAVRVLVQAAPEGLDVAELQHEL